MDLQSTAVLSFSAFLIIGCTDESTTAPPTPTIQAEGDTTTAPAADAVTFLDAEELQEGAGPVDEDLSKEFQTTASGLKYRVLRDSDGPKATAADSVTVHYRGWLDDGSEFDSSYGRGETISFPLSGVIKGWTQGMQLVGKGGMIELWIPPDLGYGAQGAGGAVPPNATLHFVVELMEIQ